MEIDLNVFLKEVMLKWKSVLLIFVNVKMVGGGERGEEGSGVSEVIVVKHKCLCWSNISLFKYLLCCNLQWGYYLNVSLCCFLFGKSNCCH